MPFPFSCSVTLWECTRRTLKWLINNAVRKEKLAEEALQSQPELFRQKT